MPADEGSLVEQAKTDPEAFGLLYDRYAASIYRMAYARMGNVAAAEDVTAEVFINALRAIPRYRDRGRPFACWLHQIARNEVANHFRHHRDMRELGDALPDKAAPVEARAIQRLEVEALWRLVDRLPRQQRTAMILRFREDRSDRETAEIMGKSQAAVKLLIYRAVQRLRCQVAPPCPDPGLERSALAVS
jgi:RNA polymerase sigma-70 factor, ECF subfamily